jgi:hypothetical protein
MSSSIKTVIHNHTQEKVSTKEGGEEPHRRGARGGERVKQMSIMLAWNSA